MRATRPRSPEHLPIQREPPCYRAGVRHVLDAEADRGALYTASMAAPNSSVDDSSSRNVLQSLQVRPAYLLEERGHGLTLFRTLFAISCSLPNSCQPGAPLDNRRAAPCSLGAVAGSATDRNPREMNGARMTLRRSGGSASPSARPIAATFTLLAMIETPILGTMLPSPRPRIIFAQALEMAVSAEADQGAAATASMAAPNPSLLDSSSRNARQAERSVALTSSRKAATASPVLPYLFAIYKSPIAPLPHPTIARRGP